MKRMSMLGAALLGMGTGAFLYSYCEHHPIKIGKMKKTIENAIKDFN